MKRLDALCHSTNLLRACAIALALLLVAGAATAQIHLVSDDVRRAQLHDLANVAEMVQVPMRDGVRLATTLYVPKNADSLMPAIFWRTPYNTSRLAGSNPNRPSALLKYALEAVERGYVFIVQNERGKFYSEGTWEILGRPRTDGYDALTWIAEQPWSSGSVATLGCSSTAEWQMALAGMDHPAHSAAVPMGQGAGIGKMGPFYEQGNFYRGGALQLPMAVWLHGEQDTVRPTFPADLSRAELVRLARGFDLAARHPSVEWATALWHLPIRDLMESVGGPPGFFAQNAQRMPADPAWREGGLYRDDEAFSVPALFVNSWYDLSVGPNLALFEHVRSKADAAVRDDQYMVVAPTLHCAMYRLKDPYVVGEMNLGSVDFGFDDIVWNFLDRYTKGVSPQAARQYDADTPRVRYYALGANEWRTSEDWPPKTRTREFLLTSGQAGANSLSGDGRLMPRSDAIDAITASIDTIVYDPNNPVPTRGGNFCCLGGAPEGPFDQRGVEARQDVLVYTSDALSEPLDVVGSVEVILHVSSDAPDTDITVKLVDVAPDGTAFNLDDSILRLRYREGFDRKVLMEPGEVYEVRVGPLSTANVFKTGHRLRLEVSSSNFPRYDRNLNTGGNNWDETEGRVARNVVYSGGGYESRVVMGVRH